MIKSVFQLIRALQSNTRPEELASGIVMSMYFGFTPLDQTQVIFLILAFFIFKINRATALVFFPIFKLLYILGLASLADIIGSYLLLDVSSLNKVWSFVSHAPILALLSLNHTLVMGGFILSILLTIPVYIASKLAVLNYRSTLKPKLEQLRIVRWIKGLSIFKWIYSWWPKN